MKINFTLVFTILTILSLKAQNITVGSIDMIEQRSRNEQLLGNANPLVSYTLRPLATELVDSTQTKSDKKINLKILPVTLTLQNNSNAPSGWNDGSMIPAKGYQSLLSAGLFAEYKFLSVQFKPEHVYAANPNYDIYSLYAGDRARTINAYYLNTIDLPAPFGDRSYNKLNWGQSNIKLNINKFSLGLSTENLWWGPGNRNALVMSNNAAGFLHFTLNTRRPVETSIGSFEGQIISGKLVGSGRTSPKSQFIVNGKDLEIPKKDDWRYINGLSINYQPKWIPGLFLGMNRTIQVYHDDMGNSFSDYFPIFGAFQKKNLNGEDAKKRDQLASLFFRWAMKESKFEFYGERGWNDHSQNLDDLLESPEHSRAYLFGFSKLFILNKTKNVYLKVNFETTHLEQTADRIVRTAGAWYIHNQIHHGYTNNGEVLGAGIGPGGNSQTLDFSVWGKNQTWGIQVERYAHNMDFYYDVYNAEGWSYLKWVDLGLNTYAYKKFGNWGIQAKINTIFINNYQYQFENNPVNMHLQLSVQYHL